MHVIPVIDCLNGTCVHARKGQRTRYQPINSCLTDSSQPIDIVKAFMDVYPFKTLYIADLNAIQSLENTGTSHRSIVENIQDCFPDLTLWIDAGINTTSVARIWSRLGAQVVLGSESFHSIAAYETLTKQLETSFTLSLDFLAEGYRGPNELLTQANYWPKALIVMMLANVGAGNGVDINKMKRIMQDNPQQDFYAAGGVRDLDDLLQLQALKVKGALIASALHNKQLSTTDLETLTIAN